MCEAIVYLHRQGHLLKTLEHDDHLHTHNPYALIHNFHGTNARIVLFASSAYYANDGAASTSNFQLMLAV